MTPAWRRYVRPQDFIWLLFFSALAIFSPERDPRALFALGTLGVVQVLEPRLGAIPSVVLKLLLCYPLIGYGGGVSSSFYLVLFLPATSAATSFDFWEPRSLPGSVREYLSFFSSLANDEYLPLTPKKS